MKKRNKLFNLKNVKSCIITTTVFIVLMFSSGCNFWGGAAVGAAGAGAAYEYGNKRQMDRLEEDYEAGNITREEYESRKRQIEEGSIVY